MNNSAILRCISNFFAAFMSLFEHSGFRRIQKAFGSWWSRVSSKSLIVNRFETCPRTADFAAKSLVGGFLSAVLRFGRAAAAPIMRLLGSSKVFCAVRNWYLGFFVKSVRGYCSAVFAAAACYAVPKMITGNLAPWLTAAAIAVMIVCALGSLADKSLAAMFSNSVAARFVSRLFEAPLSPTGETQGCSRTFMFVHTLLGGLVGIAALRFGIAAPLVAAALIGAGTFVANYRIALFAALIFMPFIPTMAVVGLVLISAASFALKILADKDCRMVHTPLDAPLGIFALVMFISAVTSFARGNSINIFLVYFAFVLSYYLAVNAVRTKRQLFALITAMLFAGVGVALYGIYQHIFGFAEGTTWTDTDMFEDIATRVISTFGNPNVLGEYLLLLIPIGAGYILARPSAFNKFISLGVTALLSLCMVYTYSRGNWIGLMVAIALFFMFYDGRIVWLGVIAMFFAPMLLPQTVINRFMSVGDTTDTSTSYRVYIWMGTISMLRDYWLCGVGLGSEAFNAIYPYYSYSGIVAPHSHNLYLQIITENGFLGIVAFVAIIFTYYRMSISAIVKLRRNKHEKMLTATVTGLAAGMFGYLVQGMFDNVWYNYRIVFMFYIILALTACAARCGKEKSA